MSIELINKVAELAAEVGKAQLILESKDQQVEQMQKHIETQQGQINEMNAQLMAHRERMAEERTAQRPATPKEIYDHGLPETQ